MVLHGPASNTGAAEMMRLTSQVTNSNHNREVSTKMVTLSAAYPRIFVTTGVADFETPGLIFEDHILSKEL